MSSTSNEAYEAPRVLTVLQTVFSSTRKEYSTDFAKLFGDSEEQKSYRAGLIFLSCIIGLILALWSFILLSLKCKGVDSVGCAAGGAFRPRQKAMASNPAKEHKSSQKPLDDASFHSSIPSEEEDEESLGSSVHDELSIYSTSSKPSPREKRTQIAFFIFGLLTIACIPLALIFSIGPLKESTSATLDHVEDGRTVLDEAESSVNTISEGVENSLATLQNLPMTYLEVCPLGDRNEIMSLLGFDIDAIIAVYASQYSDIGSNVSAKIEEVEMLLDVVSDSLDIVETSANETENYIWLVPGLLLLLGTVTAIVLFGVVVAWKRNSNQRFQRFLSYGILPLFIVMSLVIWVVAIGAAVTTAAGADACTSGESQGSPDVTIEAILSELEVDQDGLLLTYVSAYTSGCQRGVSPTIELSEYETELQGIVDTIWQYLSAIDSAGRGNVRYVCGDENELAAFLDGLQNLAKQLTSVLKALDSISASLSCSRIHPIYQEAIEQSMCTDVVSASGWGFLIFFAIAVMTMSMITLRSSWRQTIHEDKIYDESEVAENMIFDEHEEYLAYISRYKHEWEEYEGVGAAVAEQRTSIADSESDDSKEDSESDEKSDYSSDGDIVIPVLLPLPDSKPEAFDPYNSDSRSQSTTISEDISFLSLSDVRTPVGSPESRKKSASQQPSPLLLQQSNSMELEDMDTLSPPTLRPGNGRAYSLTTGSFKLMETGCESIRTASFKMKSSTVD